MNIDRNNYEEFFILYMDNELPAHERREVEEFIHSNPDLEEELVMMRQSRVVPDYSVTFPQKDLLRKKGTHSVDISNYQQYLLLYIDNELTAHERSDVEKFVLLHPSVNRELLLLQQTRLQPDGSVVFPDKTLLYKTGKEKRVIPIRWLRAAIAAAVIFAAGITTFIIIKKDSSVTPPDITVIKQNPPANAPVRIIPRKEQGYPSDTTVISNEGQSTALVNKKIEQAVLPDAQVRTIKVNKVQQVQLQKPDVAAVNSPEKTNEAVKSNNLPDRAIVDVNTVVAIKKPSSQQIINNSLVTPEDASTYNQSDPVMYASNDESKNKKLRGFFRKAARIFERTTNINPADDDDKLLVGSFTINLK